MTSKLDLKQAYTEHLAHVSDKFKSESASMAQAIGGEFEAFGIIEREMLKHYGLGNDSYLIDVGCGSGRLAKPLAELPSVRYLGTDIVSALVDYARTSVNRSDWTFKTVDDLAIPEKDAVADMVCFFSVFTHLLHEQSYIYLEEAKRVLKPGGTVVLSFLEFNMAFHWNVFEATINDARGANQHPLNVFIERNALAAGALHLGLEVVEMRDGSEAFVPLPNPLTLEDGRVVEGFGNLGQSICVLRKPVGQQMQPRASGLDGNQDSSLRPS